MPEGMGLNPSGSVGLGECTDGQFKKGERTYDNACPANSRIGSVTIESPPLAQPLTGVDLRRLAEELGSRIG